MKNALIIALLALGLTAFFGFTDGERIAPGDRTEYAGHMMQSADTIPAKKDTSKWKSKKTPYDSFGKPKTMDSITVK